MCNFTLILTAAGFLWSSTAPAQQRVSPHEKTSATIAGKTITIEYGRPYMKGRNIFGGLVPYGTVWRTGADEATKLTTDANLEIGGLRVPKGSYSLFTIPGENSWKLVVNKVANQWGAFNYKESADLGRVDMKVESITQPVEQLTISLTRTGGDNGLLKIAWANTVVTVPFEVLP